VSSYLEKVAGEIAHETRRKEMEDGLEAGRWVVYPHSELHLAMRDLERAGLNPRVNSSLSLMHVSTAPFDPMGLTSVSLALGS
jgi:hypothetical protein